MGGDERGCEPQEAWWDAKPNCQGFDSNNQNPVGFCAHPMVPSYKNIKHWHRNNYDGYVKKSSIKGNVFDFFGCERPPCCTAKTLSCLSCQAKLSIKEFCEKNHGKYGCPKKKKICCKAQTKECLACTAGQTPREFCKNETNWGKYGCPLSSGCLVWMWRT